MAALENDGRHKQYDPSVICTSLATFFFCRDNFETS